MGKGTAFVIIFPPCALQSKVDANGAHEAEVVENVHPLPEDDTVEQEGENRDV